MNSVEGPQVNAGHWENINEHIFIVYLAFYAFCSMWKQSCH